MKFEWDQQKNQANIANHELDFTDAFRIFSLPLRISLDERQNEKIGGLESGYWMDVW